MITKAQTVAETLTPNRLPNITAAGAFNATLNDTIAYVANVDIFHREIVYKDGSILTVLDQSAARKLGLTDFEHAFKHQERAY